MRRLTFPVPLSSAGLVAGGTGLLVLLHGAPLLSWPYGDWRAVSAESRQALTLAGPWLAGCCAWTAARFSSPRSLLCPPAAPRSGADLVRGQLPVLCGAAFLGYLLGLLPVFILTALGAQAGAPDLLVVLGGVALLAAFACGGYLIGCILPLSMAPVLAAIASFATVVLSDFLGPAVAPVWTMGVVAGQHENWAVGVFRISLFGLVAVCCVAAAVRWLRERTVPVSLPSMAALLVLLIPLPLIVVGTQRLPSAVERETDPPQRCVPSNGIGICVHAARGALLQPLAEAVGRVQDAMGPAAPSGIRVLDATLWGEPTSRDVVLHLQAQMGRAWTQAAVADMAFQLSGLAACSQRLDASGSLTTGPELDAAATSGAVGIWIARRSGADGTEVASAPDAIALAEDLESRSIPEVQEMLKSQQVALTSCTASSGSLR